MDEYLRAHAPARVLAAAAAAAADRAAVGLPKSLYFPLPNDDVVTWDTLLGTAKAVREISWGGVEIDIHIYSTAAAAAADSKDTTRHPPPPRVHPTILNFLHVFFVCFVICVSL